MSHTYKLVHCKASITSLKSSGRGAKIVKEPLMAIAISWFAVLGILWIAKNDYRRPTTIADKK